MATTRDEQVRHETHHETDGSDRSLTSLLKELRDESTALMREEITLAKTEISEKVSRVARNGGYLAAGAMIAFAGLIILLAAASTGLYVGLLMWGVAAATAVWLAPLIVGIVVLVIGYALLQKAISTLKRESAVPERTARSIEEDKQWIKQKVTQ